jgi:hypothetical protein
VRFKRTLSKFLMILACFISLPTIALAAPVKVAILPFTIKANGDHADLQKNIAELLNYRLAREGAVEILPSSQTAEAVKSVQGLSGDSLALMAAARLKADYAVYGRVSAGTAQTVKIHVRMLNVTGGLAPLDFKAQAPDISGVIPQVNHLANQINTKALNPSAAAMAPLPEPVVATTLQKPGPAPNPPPAPKAETASALNPAFISIKGRSQENGFWKGPDMEVVLNGMAVGDVNQDSLQETILLTQNGIRIVQITDDRLHKLADIDSPRFTLGVGVDVADINDNGRPEIFVTALTTGRNALASYVVEFDGRRFQTLGSGLGWFFRVVPAPGKGRMLLGQGQKSGQSPMAEPIVELQWKDQRYVVAKEILPAGKANALGVAAGDILNNGNPRVLAYDEYDHLQILSSQGERVWRGEKYFGGSPVYYALPRESPGDSPAKFYLPVRMVVADLDGNGRREVILPQNMDSAYRKLKKRRFYTEGKLLALQWDGLGMEQIWETRKLSGRIQDIAIADFDNDGVRELVAAVISQEKAVIGTNARSTVIAFELNPQASLN